MKSDEVNFDAMREMYVSKGALLNYEFIYKGISYEQDIRRGRDV